MLLYNVNRDNWRDVIPYLPKTGVVIVASRPGWGENRFLSFLIGYYCGAGAPLKIWDLYGDSLDKTLEKLLYSRRTPAESVSVKWDEEKRDQRIKLLSQINETDKSDVLILIGIQAMQINPFEPKEMTGLLEKIKELSEDREKPVIVYSGLRMEADTHTPCMQDLEKIGITEQNGISVIMLDNLFLGKLL
ncbi:MAG: hypothetical protein J6M64_03770 [Oscillospiraceae bacterium]|nr:hypothetical protein [Oscillospiraceae bacterium]